MDIHRKSVDMDMDMDVKFHIHGNPVHNEVQKCVQSKNQFRFCTSIMPLLFYYAVQHRLHRGRVSAPAHFHGRGTSVGWKEAGM